MDRVLKSEEMNLKTITRYITTTFECPRCGKEYPAQPLPVYCSSCDARFEYFVKVRFWEEIENDS